MMTYVPAAKSTAEIAETGTNQAQNLERSTLAIFIGATCKIQKYFPSSDTEENTTLVQMEDVKKAVIDVCMIKKMFCHHTLDSGGKESIETNILKFAKYKRHIHARKRI